MLSHASAAGSAARTGQRSPDHAVIAMSPPTTGDIGPEPIPSNIYEDRVFEAADLPQRLGEHILTRHGGDFLKDDRWRHEAGSDRGPEPQHFIPVLLDDGQIGRSADQRCERRIVGAWPDHEQLAVAQISDARCEAIAVLGIGSGYV